jgi:outer membrane protein
VFNLDLKYVKIETGVESGGSKIYDLEINPWVIGAGLGYRF